MSKALKKNAKTEQHDALRKSAREKLLKYKIYKWVAILFAFGAFFVSVN